MSTTISSPASAITAPQDNMSLCEPLQPYRYTWPATDFAADSRWTPDGTTHWVRQMPETLEQLAVDSRWPAFFPSPISIVTVSDGHRTAMEKTVGASIVNRFPYVIALSFVRRGLSARHHVRTTFMDILEAGGGAVVQFLPPGPILDQVMSTILTSPEDQTHMRIEKCGIPARPGVTTHIPVLSSAFMAYEARLVRPGRDLEGNTIFAEPWRDVGSHRVYFLEITAIQLREDIARGKSQIAWRSLPLWNGPVTPQDPKESLPSVATSSYQKGYNPNYRFPSSSTTAFEFDSVENGMAIRRLPSTAADQIELDSDRARWPCFFPSSVGMITTWGDDGKPNLMPCGSTTVISRHPMVITPCVSYARVNERYAPRASLEIIRRTGKFGCGIPFTHPFVIDAIKYCGNNSIVKDPHKLARSGLTVQSTAWAPVLTDLPIHFDCQVTGEVRLGTHIMFLGEVKQIRINRNLTPQNPLEWCPWSAVLPR